MVVKIAVAVVSGQFVLYVNTAFYTCSSKNAEKSCVLEMSTASRRIVTLFNFWSLTLSVHSMS